MRFSKNILKFTKTKFPHSTEVETTSSQKKERSCSDTSLTAGYWGSSMNLDEDGGCCSDNDSISSSASKQFETSFHNAPSSATVNVLLSQLKAFEEDTIDEIWDETNKEKTVELIEESVRRLTSINMYLRKRLHLYGRVVRLHVAANHQEASVQSVKKVLALESELEKTINAINLLGMLALEARRRNADESSTTEKVNFKERFQMIISESVPLIEVVGSELAEEAAARVIAL